MYGGFGLRRSFFCSRPVAANQLVEIVTVGSVGAECCLIKQALDAAAQANLIGVILKAHRPTHLAVPAAAKDHDSGCS